jgi:hypothetical protein
MADNSWNDQAKRVEQDYTMFATGPDFIIADQNTGTQEINLPSIATVPEGKFFKIYKPRNSGTVRINLSGSDKIDMPTGHGDIGSGETVEYVDLKHMGELFQCFKTEGAAVHWYTIPQLIWIPEQGRVDSNVLTSGSSTSNADISFSSYAHAGCYMVLAQSLVRMNGNGSLDSGTVYNTAGGVSADGQTNQVMQIYDENRTSTASKNTIGYGTLLWWELENDRDATYAVNDSAVDLWVRPPHALMRV